MKRKGKWLAAFFFVGLIFMFVFSSGQALAGSTFKVGSFAKSGDAAPVDQTVAHGLGVTPKAIILWSAANTVALGFGATDGTTSKSVTMSSETNSTTGNTDSNIASKALTLDDWGQPVLAECDFSSWDSTNFTLTWTSNNNQPYTINFIAIGGTDISAKVVEWTIPTSTGNTSVDTIGFKPVVCIHAHARYSSTVTDGIFGLGAMDYDGDQWANTIYSVDNALDMDTQRGQQTDSCIYEVTNSLGISREASWVSMDDNGFTVNFSTVQGSASKSAFSLCLKGLHAKVGTWNKSTNTSVPASDPVTGVGFQPSLVLLTSFQDTTQANPVAESRWGIGASDGTNERSTYYIDKDTSAKSFVRFVASTTKVFMKVNNNTPSIDAEADFSSFGADGFTLSWSTNDAVATQMLYLALGSLSATEAKLKSFTATDYDGRVHLQWQTGHEANNLGFHLYREENGERVRLTPEIIPGSALSSGVRTVLKATRSYEWWDTALSPQSSDPVLLRTLNSERRTIKYWLEDIDLKGKRTWHGPVEVNPSAMSSEFGVRSAISSQLPDREATRLSDLGARLNEKYRDYWKVQDFKEKLGLKQPQQRLRTGNKVPLRTDPPGLEVGGFKRKLDHAANEMQWLLAGRPAVKISVKEEGWYRISQANLVAAGLNPRANPRYLRLFVDGKEQPIRVNGKRDRTFHSEDSIEFYGTGLDTPSTDTRIYWLLEGKRPGKRIKVLPPRGRGWGELSPHHSALSPSPLVLAPRSFPSTVELKERSIYFGALRNGEKENFFGPVIWSQPLEKLLNVLHPDPSLPGEALLQVALQGVSALPHRVKVLLNGEEVGEVAFEGQVTGSAEFVIPQSEILEEQNLVSLIAQNGETDISLLDHIRLSYWHTYRADEDSLKFTADGGKVLTVDGFSKEEIRVIDITNPGSAGEIVGVIEPLGFGYAITIKAPGKGSRTLLAFAGERIKEPMAIKANQPSTWHRRDQRADMVIIGHGDILEALKPLKAFRESQGWTVALIDVEDLYDEFSFGTKTPQAIKDFIDRAHSHWQRPIRFVLLVGDASYDPRNYQGYGDFDLVPTRLIDTDYMETSSDDWFVDLNGDGLPEIAIGRLPLQKLIEAETVVSKIIDYEQGSGNPVKEILLVADQDAKEFDFEAASLKLGEMLPLGMIKHEIYRSRFDDEAQAKRELLERLNQGPLIVNYLGHGSMGVWWGDLFSTKDAEELTNGSNLSFFVSMTCLNGFFHAPWEDGLGEALIKSEQGGAIAVWASSALTEPQGQAQMSEELFGLLLGGERLTLGEAVVRAKAAMEDMDTRRTWIFLGDPATRLRK